jgi:transcription elongation factor Elf1
VALASPINHPSQTPYLKNRAARPADNGSLTKPKPPKGALMKLNLDDQTLDITCPGCSKKISERIGRLKNSPQLTCHSCGQKIDTDAAELRSGIATAQKSIDKLSATLRDAFKR